MAKSLEDLRKRVRTAPDWVLPGLLKRGNTAFLIGPPKRACKSWLMLAMGWDLSEGKPVWGIKTASGQAQFTPSRPMRTVYLTQEDTEDDIHDRVECHFDAGRLPNDKLWIIPKNMKIALDTDVGRAELQRELDWVATNSGPIDLVMFDPMRRLHHGDENDSQAIARMWEVLDRVHRKYQCATLISHHTVKPPRGEARGSFDPSDPFVARGSGDIYGGGDAFMVVVPKKLTTGVVDAEGRTIEMPTRRLCMYFESKRGRPLPPAMMKVSLGTGGVEYLGVGWDRKPADEEDIPDKI